MAWFDLIKSTGTEKKEHRLKIRIRRKYEAEDEIPAGILPIPMPDMPVVDALTPFLKLWCFLQAIIVSAPTGSGKSTFISKIVNYAKSRNEEVLVLVHRSLLCSQHKRRLPFLTNSIWKNVHDDLSLKLTSFFKDVNLTIMTYQELWANQNRLDFSRFKWVVLDEAHFFHSDALFNESADALLKKIPVWFCRAQRIYMTATPGAVLEDIVRVEQQNPIRCSGTRSCSREGCGQILMYDFPNHFSGLHLRYFRKIQEIVRLVLSHPEDKFLIFVSVREEIATDLAISYVSALRAAGIEVAYLDSTKKNSDVWNKLAEENTFSARVLVATSVIDAGINILDDSLRHIVLETTNKTEFIQMIGRKRRKDGEEVNIYVRSAASATLNYRLQLVNRWIEICNRAFQSNSNNPDFPLLMAGWTDKDTNRPYAKLLVPLATGGFYVKPTAYHALLWQQGTLNRLIRMGKEYNDDSALPRLVHEWLEDPGGYSEGNWLGYDRLHENRLELIQFLEANSHRDLCGAEYDEFRTTLQNHLSELLVKPHDSNRLLGERALNDRLKDLGIPFFIKKEDGFYKIYIKE